MRRFFSLLSSGERLRVELDTPNNELVIFDNAGRIIRIPSGFPLAQHSLRILLPLALAGLVEKYTQGTMSTELHAGLDADGEQLPVGARSLADEALARQHARRGSFVSISETLDANARTHTFVFEIVANTAHLEPPALAC